MEKNLVQVRDWECGCGHAWTAPVVLDAHTSRLSGERTEWCPKGGKRQLMGWPVRNVEETTDVD